MSATQRVVSLASILERPESDAIAFAEVQRRLAAIRRNCSQEDDVRYLADRISWRLRPSLVRKARVEWGSDLADARRHALCVALLLAIATERLPQRVRIGRTWLDGGQDVIPANLPLRLYARWLCAEAVRHAESVLCLPKDRFVDALLREPKPQYRELNAPRVAPVRPHPLVDLDVAMRLRDELSPQQRAIVDLFACGLNRAQIAARLGTKPDNVRTASRRVGARVRAVLMADHDERERRAISKARAVLGLASGEDSAPGLPVTRSAQAGAISTPRPPFRLPVEGVAGDAGGRCERG